VRERQDDIVSVVHLICGLPGAGKTTLAREIATSFDAVRMCPDDWMMSANIDAHDSRTREVIESVQWSLGLGFLDVGRDVVVEWGTWAVDERETIRSDAAKRGHQTWAYFLHPPLAVLIHRVEMRNLLLPETAQMTADDLIASLAYYQVPSAAECALYDKCCITGSATYPSSALG
jgi:predicted kinase